MLTIEQKNSANELAYAPEHSVDLMTGVSGGDPFMYKDYLCLERGEQLIVVGFPLKSLFNAGEFETDLQEVSKIKAYSRISVISPERLANIEKDCAELEEDRYYTLDLSERLPIRRGLLRKAEEALGRLNVTSEESFTKDHEDITAEFLERINPQERVKRLYEKIPNFLAASPDARLLSARDSRSRLCAYYAMDIAPKDFSTYIVGCHSKQSYSPGASDALFLEMINISLNEGKRYMHLGLGVNKGIRQFKKKWGAKPVMGFFRYETLKGKRGWLNAIMTVLQGR